MSCAHHPACRRPAPPRPLEAPRRRRRRPGLEFERVCEPFCVFRTAILLVYWGRQFERGAQSSSCWSVAAAMSLFGDKKESVGGVFPCPKQFEVRNAVTVIIDRSLTRLQGHFPSVDHYLAHAVFKNPLNKGLAILAAPSLTSLETFVLMMTDRNLYKYTPAYKRVWQSVRTYYTLKLTTCRISETSTLLILTRTLMKCSPLPCGAPRVR